MNSFLCSEWQNALAEAVVTMGKKLGVRIFITTMNEGAPCRVRSYASQCGVDTRGYTIGAYYHMIQRR